MKRALFVFAVVLLLAAPVLAQGVTLTVLSPNDGDEVFAGREISIKGEIYIPEWKTLLSLDSYLDSKKMACTSVRKMDTTRGFSCPVTPLTTGDVNISIGANVSGVIYTKTLRLRVTNRLDIELVYPTPNVAANLDDMKHIKVRLKYPESDEQYGQREVVDADVNGQMVKLIWDSTEKMFAGAYDLERFEPNKPYDITIRLLGDVSGSKTFHLVISGTRPPVEPEFVFITVVGGVGAAVVIIVIVLRYFVSRRLQRFALKMQKEKGIGEINDETQQIKEEMKIFEQQFYKNRVPKADFEKGMLTYQAKLRALEAGKKQLEGKKREAAQAYEKAGNYNEARKLYKELDDKESVARVNQLELRRKVLRQE